MIEAVAADPITEEAELPEGATGELLFKVLGPSGDDRIVWQKGFLDSIKEAREKFYELLKKGYVAYAVKSNGMRTNRRMFKFDPRVEEVVMVPMLQGG